MLPTNIMPAVVAVMFKTSECEKYILIDKNKIIKTESPSNSLSKIIEPNIFNLLSSFIFPK